MLVWIDIESTGLSAAENVLLEVAVVVTDDDLGNQVFSSWVTNEARKRSLDYLPERVREMHTKNGLWEQSVRAGMDLAEVEREVLAFVKRHVPEPGTAQLAGSSVWFDRTFLERYMPSVVAHLHYRMLDVSSINEAARRFWPAVYAERPQKPEDQKPHRALPDIFESIAVLSYYRHSLGDVVG